MSIYIILVKDYIESESESEKVRRKYHEMQK